MKYKEFLEYMEKNLEGYRIFTSKALQYQRGKNAKRAPKSRWNDEKLQKAAYSMWKMSMENLYNNLKREINSDIPSAWTSYIKENELFEIINENISDLDFSDDAA